MLLRTLLFGGLALAGALVVIMAMSPGIVMGFVKDDFVRAYEDAGLDVSECKKRKKTLFDPSGGMPECMQSTFRDLSRRLDEDFDPESDRR